MDRMFRVVVACLLFAWPALATAQPGPETPSFLVGACTHFSQGKGIVELNIDSIKGAGIDAIRDEVGWGSIEREKGQLVMPERFDKYVRQAAAQGLHVLLILDYANRFYDDGDRPRSPEAIEGFCRYAEFVVRHFGDDVRLYEVWNEWDIGIGLPERHRKGGSPADYVKLLKAVYPRIKAAYPDAIVMAGGSTSGGVKRGWLEGIVKLGALDHCDAISIHSYNYNDKFPQRGPEACSAWMTDVQAMLARYNDGADVPFYVTEMGWPTHVTKGGTDPELSASYLARLYLLARTSPAFKGLWWYDFQDDGWNPKYNEDNFGLVRPDLTPKPAYHVLADISELLGAGHYINSLTTDDEHLRGLHFDRDGRDCWMLWSADDQDRQVVLKAEHPGGMLRIQQVGYDPYVTRWGFRAWADRRAEFVPDRLAFVVGHRPVMISGDLSGVAIADVVGRSRQDEEEK
ncbi:MAG: cellulase family glycosylhydrolase [Phycisphaerales bacterium]|nr:MAG: cellulase family glycosylhydrolase [Phycisphaerales bacterium]